MSFHFFNKKLAAMMKQNSLLEEKLTEANKSIETNMIVCLRVSNISKYHQEMARNDILEMILPAQERGDNLADIIGGDYQAFCDDIIQEMPQLDLKARILQNFEILLPSFIVLCIIKLCFTVISKISSAAAGESAAYLISVSAGDILAALLITGIAFFLVTLIGKHAFTERLIQNKAARFGAALLLILAGAAALYLGKITLFTIPMIAFAAIIIVLFGIHKLISYRMND